MERIINFEIEHLNEMGDLCHKGAYYRADGQIFKHHLYRLRWYDNRQCQAYSRIRKLCAWRCFLAEPTPSHATQEDKYNPLTVDSKQFADIISAKPLTVSKAIYSSFSGISPLWQMSWLTGQALTRTPL